MRKAVLFLFLVPLLAVGQEPAKKPDVLSPFKYFLGNWQGTGKGEVGVSQVEREYQPILHGKYIQIEHKSVYAPQEKKPKGETHEEIGFISFARGPKAFMMRQFHVTAGLSRPRSGRKHKAWGVSPRIARQTLIEPAGRATVLTRTHFIRSDEIKYSAAKKIVSASAARSAGSVEMLPISRG